jgi:hypothetical protein
VVVPQHGGAIREEMPLITRWNIARYHELLKNETDEKTREILRRLLLECEAELPRPKRSPLR